ncbi:ABC transporter permease [Streptomyces sp. NPDC056956]|uniref:ABC transporter permease n=1 Tax=Streptomyces sp. NPDC056956 TaxID=3345980 RepID=UPI0036255FE3
MTAAPTAPPAPAAPAAPAPPTAAPRQLRWLLRLHRPAVTAWAAFTVLAAVALLWLGGPLTSDAAAAWKDYRACAFDERCAYDQDAILAQKDLYRLTTYALLTVPLLVAAWAGSALTGREAESGTARLGWTQGVSPLRWLAARLALPALLVTASTALLAALHRWAWTAGDGRVDTAKPWYDAATFYAGGLLPVALALAGLAAGALAGLLLGRSLPALAAGAAALGALWTALHHALPHLWPSVTRVSGPDEGPSGSGLWVGEGVLVAGGERADAPCLNALAPGCRGELEQLGATGFYRDFHPAAHYWPLQLVGAGVLLLVTALLTVAAFRLLRRRTA